MPGLFDLTGNYCDFANGTSLAAKFVVNTVNVLAPEIYEDFKKRGKNCPLMV
jgi:hypothetical protein